MPIVISTTAAAGSAQPVQLHEPVRDGSRERRAKGLIIPSRLRLVSMEFQTWGPGSWAARNSPAAQAITSRSATSPAQCGQSLKWARCAAVPPLSFSIRLSCNSTQVITALPKPLFHCRCFKVLQSDFQPELHRQSALAGFLIFLLLLTWLHVLRLRISALFQIASF